MGAGVGVGVGVGVDVGRILSFAAWTLVAIAGAAEARAENTFTYGGKPVHPGCVHALAMEQGDRAPVTTAVSLEGCASSERSKSTPHADHDVLTIEDDALLGGGSFGYRVLNRLDNGIFGLAIRRIAPDGTERVSLAAVQLVPRAMIQNGKVNQVMLIELLGELWVPEMQLSSFRAMGNSVHFVSGTGRDRVERNVDLTRLGRQRK